MITVKSPGGSGPPSENDRGADGGDEPVRLEVAGIGEDQPGRHLAQRHPRAEAPERAETVTPAQARERYATTETVRAS
ncbi:hypothetical protein [Amycolatopsis anabasis]|uniref:hypothetical protein n=1 Tax=Amycolatopsis anabasis TaxID=1840409 RepID=UPI00131C92A6|nr:hypothetical protein [Amycolatopsis anabasis]